MKTDRRSLRTRQMLMGAMVDLMRSKRYDSITVQEITDQANIGRSTFYAHFTDKDDLLVDGVHRMLAGLTTATAATGRHLLPSLALLHHIGAQADMYQVLARGRGLHLFMTALEDELTTMLTERLTARLAADTTPAVPPPLLAAMIVGMLTTAIRAWVGGGCTEPAEDIDRMFRTAAVAAVRAGLRHTPPDEPPDPPTRQPAQRGGQHRPA
ncbi:TetR family transcriptional regulator [Dactylosporangium roseum]|uniref:TetR family transcriptional regulator n=1 Tax=Dactylosporangium roseum TaxID=47989 RepID=A0ABY5Z2U2_9ACTN|nr:TetR/AcrR family transcriptional regulator [Dactylosporangium roseum]UWZ36350.1 TetR family transcriptional regulator [Dactylosporangium roseum]